MNGGADPRTGAPTPAESGGTASSGTFAERAQRIWVGRWTVLGYAAVTAVLAGLISLIIPPTYEAVTTAIPISPNARTGGIEALSLRAQELGIAPAPQTQHALTYPDIVRSRRLLERVLRTSFPTGSGSERVLLIDLVQPNGREPRRTENALRKLRRQVDAIVDRRTGLLTLRVRSARAPVAAGAANALRAGLQEYAITSMTRQAGENRKFIEGRLRDARAELARAEERLRAFREDNLRIGNSPRLLLEQGRLAREVRAQEEVFLALTREYEMEKVAEHRDVPVIAVLDSASVPASRVAPRRATTAAVGFLIGGVLAGMIVVNRSEPSGRPGRRVPGGPASGEGGA